MDRQGAALKIQRAWKRFTNTKIYEFYKNLILFHGRGDPAQLLKCINPSEASLIMDAASGGCVRFRLGGESFPPMIYYKIFLKDIGAFAPRDYTVEKLPLPADLHTITRKDRVPKEWNREGWYHREENNGWRPVAHKVQFSDVVSIDSHAKRIPDWHYSRLQRQKDAVTKRKQRKVAWLKKLYTQKEGKELHVAEGRENLDSNELALTAEEEDIFSWAQGLGVDFDAYYENWMGLAATACVGPRGTMISTIPWTH